MKNASTKITANRRINKRNRLNNYYKRLFLISLSVLVISIFFAFATMSNNAKADDINNVQYKYFYMMTVEKGDSLWKLASDCGYGDCKNKFTKEVMKINKLKSDQLIEGQKIVVPYYSYEFKL